MAKPESLLCRALAANANHNAFHVNEDRSSSMPVGADWLIQACQYDRRMTKDPAASHDLKWHKIQQAIKWLVYTLLIINFVFYVFEDWDRAAHTLDSGSSIVKWLSEFANTLDESAWFLLLLLFELETYVFEDDDLKGWLGRTLHAARMFCYVIIAHTIYAYTMTISGLQATTAVADISDLCDLTGDDISYVYNLEYTEINAQTCSELSGASQFFWVDEDPVVSDMAGLTLERDLAWADLAEAVIWLFILLAIETVVRLQSRGITGGALVSLLNKTKTVLYAMLIGIGVYWATLSHWLYFWDELVWIGGFAAIEMNVSQWRDELLEKKDANPNDKTAIALDS
jgi:hypothetical protein